MIVPIITISSFLDILNSDKTPVYFTFQFESKQLDDDFFSCPVHFNSSQDTIDGIPSSSSPNLSMSPNPDDENLPSLSVIDYTVVADRMCYQCLHNKHLINKHEWFTMNYPSLYWWCIFNDGDSVIEDATWWKERYMVHSVVLYRFSIHDGFFFNFVSCWFELIGDYQQYHKKEILFPCIPGYFAVIRSFFPELQACFLHQYHCGHIRSHYFQSSYNYNIAALKASQNALIDTSLLNMYFIFQ